MAFVRALPWLLGESPSGHFRALPAPAPVETPAPANAAIATPPPAGVEPEKGAAPEKEQALEPTGQADQTMIARAPTRRPMVPIRRARAEDPPSVRDQFSHLRPVMSVHQLLEKNATPPQAKAEMSTSAFVTAVVQAAIEVTTPERQIASPQDAQKRRFLCTLPPAMIPLKLAVVAERWGLALQKPDHLRMILTRETPVTEPRRADRSDPNPRPEVVVWLPIPPSAQITLIGTVQGSPVAPGAFKAAEDLPAILDEIRMQLQNQDERRAFPRFPARFPIRIFPLYSDGEIGPPVAGHCEDVSMGGVRVKTLAPVRTERMFVEFQEVGTVAGLAVYAKHLRTLAAPTGQGFFTVCRFRISTNTPAPKGS
ncbi:MAG TPA: hypothetical protein VLM40_12695, partial [Gemmata sp.]|nr:hypothetical protein [Gemmata sp.]